MKFKHALSKIHVDLNLEEYINVKQNSLAANKMLVQPEASMESPTEQLLKNKRVWSALYSVVVLWQNAILKRIHLYSRNVVSW